MRHLFQIAALFCAALIAWGSLQPVTGTATIAHADKVIHVLAYGGLAGLAGLGWRDWRLRMIVLIVALFGVGIELAQGLLTQGRTPSIADALANTLGASLAVLFLRVLRRR